MTLQPLSSPRRVIQVFLQIRDHILDLLQRRFLGRQLRLHDLQFRLRFRQLLLLGADDFLHIIIFLRRRRPRVKGQHRRRNLRQLLLIIIRIRQIIILILDPGFFRDLVHLEGQQPVPEAHVSEQFLRIRPVLLLLE